MDRLPATVDPATGLTRPLSKSLGSQDLQLHRGEIAIELEVMAKKYDRYGWERDRGSASHDRQLTDWMDALQDYPLPEVQAACRAHVMACPGRMPNEGHIKALILEARAKRLAAMPRRVEREPERKRPTAAEAWAILAAAGYAPRKVEAGDD